MDGIIGIELGNQKQADEYFQIKGNAFNRLVLVFQKSQKVQQKKRIDNGRQDDKHPFRRDERIHAFGKRHPHKYLNEK